MVTPAICEPKSACEWLPTVIITHNKFHLLFVNIKVVVTVDMREPYFCHCFLKAHNVKWFKKDKGGPQNPKNSKKYTEFQCNVCQA